MEHLADVGIEEAEEEEEEDVGNHVSRAGRKT
jgi:hypothetical protein